MKTKEKGKLSGYIGFAVLTLLYIASIVIIPRVSQSGEMIVIGDMQVPMSAFAGVVSTMANLCIILCLLFIQVILAVEAAGSALVRMDHNLAHFTVGDGIAVRIHDIHIVLRTCFAHGADLRHGTVQVPDGQCRLRLAEAFHNLQAGRLFKLSEDLRIQRLAGSRHMVDGAEVVF